MEYALIVVIAVALSFDYVNGFHGGIPVSTTHTITGGIVGVGAARRLSAVRWGVAGRVVWAWLLTIPGAFTVAFMSFLILDLLS